MPRVRPTTSRAERASKMLTPRTRGELMMTLAVWVDDAGRVDIKIETDREQAEVAALLEIVSEQIQPDRDRADEIEAWGAARRHRKKVRDV